MHKLSLVIPAYNEEKRIRNTLIEYSNFLDSKKIDYEILVVLNGCKDNTLGVVSPIAKIHKKIKIVDIKEAIGKGGAIIEGFKLAEKDLIGFVDADNATKADAFYDLVEKISYFDGVIASRYMKGAVIANRKRDIIREIVSVAFKLLAKILFGIHYKDTQCGAKLFKKEAVKKILDKLIIKKWAFDIDLLYCLKRDGFNVIEIPSVWAEREGTKLKLTTPYEMFISLIKLRLYYSPLKFIIKRFI